MPTILKIKANSAGRYPIKLYGVEYEIEPLESKSVQRRKAAMKNEQPTEDVSTNEGGTDTTSE